MVSPPDLDIAGLDARRSQIIARHWHILDLHLSPWFAPNKPWFVALRNLERERQRELLLVTLEQAATTTNKHNGHSVLPTSQSWQDQILIPLARDLHLLGDAERALISMCLNRGWFDSPHKMLHESRRPELTKILPKIRTVLKNSQTIEKRAEALYQQHICSTARTARNVAEELTDGHIARHAIGMLLHLLGMHSAYGPIGLLSLGRDTASAELLLLEEQAADIESLTPDVQRVMSIVRSDIIALYEGIRKVNQSFWQPHLLNEPLHSNARTRYRKQLYPNVRTRLVIAIAGQLNNDHERAEKLLDCLIHKGLPGLVEWRAGLDSSDVQYEFERHGLRNTLAHITVGMAPWAQQECARLVEHLLVAVRAVELPNSLKPLLVEFPSSPLRIRWGRRVWFGLPAIMQRKQRRRRVHRIRGSRAPKVLPQKDKQPQQLSPEDKLITKFAELAQLDEQDARNRVRNFLTYGVMGLLPRKQWLWIFDPRLLSWLQLIKMGRLEGTTAWSTVLHVAGEYVHLLGIPRPSAQVLRAVFNSLPRPSYWAGGKGKAVNGLRQRATLQLKGRPKLHSAWLVIPIPLRLSLRNDKLREYFLLLIVDEASGLPVGGWLSETTLGLRELGLALYQSIWHPGIIDWPLHGIPEIVRVPVELLPGEIAKIQEQASQLLQQVANLDEQEANSKEEADQLRFNMRHERTSIAYVRNHGNSPVDKALNWLVQDTMDTDDSQTLPQTLLPEGLQNLDSAAKFLLTRIELVDKVSLEGKPSIRTLRNKVRKQGAEIIAGTLNTPNPSLGIALRDLCIWLQEECFPSHRIAPVPGEIAKYGVGMAGWDTHPAGWLLPPQEQAQINNGALTWQMQRYKADLRELASGTNVIIRAYPYTYSRRSVNDQDVGIFGEVEIDGEKRLIYMNSMS